MTTQVNDAPHTVILPSTWKILIVDDDRSIHDVTYFALGQFRFLERPITFFSAYSAEECREVLQRHHDIAVIFLDVVMEASNTGLMLVNYIRQELKNLTVRIILRTGQPGQAPKEQVLVDYDINDYLLKADMARNRIVLSTLTALRTYRDLLALEQANQQLQLEMEKRLKLEAIRHEKEMLSLEKQLIQTQAHELADMNASKDLLFSIVAHDLKTPFTPLLGFTEMLCDPNYTFSPEEVRSIGFEVHNTVLNVLHLLENLLEWSRLQMDQKAFLPESIYLHDVIELSIDLLTKQAAEKSITIDLDVDETMTVFVDINMFNIIMRNLLANALKFTSSDGTILIKATYCAEDMVEISVVDTGRGMNQEHVEQLFKLNRQYVSSDANPQTGSGLGLLICKEMVQKHGGQIWVTSQKNEGTTVTFTLPFSDDPPHTDYLTSDVKPH